MSTFDIGKINCPDIQANLTDFYATANLNQYTDIPLAFYLTSPVNTANIQSLNAFVSPGNSKLRTMQLIYTPRIPEAEISLDIDPSCVATNESGMLETTCTVDETKGVFTSEVFGLTDLARICQDNPAFIAQRLAAHLDGLVRKMETDLHTKISALAGGFSADDTQALITSDIKDIEVLTSAGNPSVIGISELRYTMMQAYSPRLYTFGNGRITKYFDQIGDGCCTDFGVDLGSFYGNSGIVHFNDNRAATALGDTHRFLGLIPGAAQLVYYNRFAGSNLIDDASYKQFTVTHGPTGLPFDVTWKNDCGNISVEVFLAYEVCSAPTNMFALNDPLSGFNGILTFDAIEAS